MYTHCNPNQYVPGGKPFGSEEQARAISPENPYREAVERGYPRLIARGRELVSEAIGFVDLTGLYAATREPIYVDDCCHVNGKGNQLMAARLADAARSVVTAAANSSR